MKLVTFTLSKHKVDPDTGDLSEPVDSRSRIILAMTPGEFVMAIAAAALTSAAICIFMWPSTYVGVCA